MARFYADEGFDADTLRQLEQLGHDVVTVADAGQRGGPDSQVLGHATTDRRVVLTFNRWHFEKLHRQNSVHAGIVSCTDDDPVALAQRIHDAVVAAGDCAGQHIRVNKPPRP